MTHATGLFLRFSAPETNEKAKTVQEKAEALYRYLEETDVPLKLDQERQRAEEDGRIIEAQRASAGVGCSHSAA